MAIFFSLPANASQKSTNVNVDVYFCNHDTVCDVSLGENSNYCADDCPLPICNNDGICNNSETISNCPSDCFSPTTTIANGGGGGGGSTSGGYISNNVTTTVSSTIGFPTSTVALPTVLASPFFSAIGQDSQIYLTWKKNNPTDVWSKVVIRRSSLFYPENINSGGLFYDGLGQTSDNINFHIYDTKLINGKRYFYTIFVFGENGEVSNGVSASALTVAKTTVSSTLEVPQLILPPETTLPKSPDYKEINFNELTIATTSPNSSLLSLPADKVPSSTYTAILTLGGQAGSQSYILGRNDGGMFVNFPTAFGVEQQLTVTFLDRNHQIISQINGKIGGTPVNGIIKPSFFQKIADKILPVITDWRVILGGILAIILFLIRFL